ncbi:DUF1775 domain-containing protein [Streptomyces radicis]|uniref:DUF1775 domain-containing protein n=1 Tax=Streptomyces radicis TaxID=1750517 RepID=A0A3A9WBJ2_9ACTN|nr:DUF1775 domain-containing protein [Streptomyces radicis]RKN10119.1 DUF1775 domain-containing protein [Streptomyces radicis]RKN24461.1 DUF1775 domain-containing protein [Streptomyces radicis]
MSRPNPSRALRRLGIVTAAAAVAVVLSAAPAAAHVEVAADTPRALAENVTLSFLAQSESSSAGITELRVVLPEGLGPEHVVYESGPEGWEFAPTEDGYTVAGPAVPAGEDAEYAVVVHQLPDAEELAFKTLQTYEDGRIDRWIELAEADGGGHGSAAPVLALEPAAPGAEPVDATEEASPSPEPEPETEPEASAPADDAEETAAEDEDDGGFPAAAWIAVVALVLALAAAGGHLARRRAKA